MVRVLALALVFILVSGCAPDRIEGVVRAEEWTETEYMTGVELSSKEVLWVRFPLLGGNKSGYDRETLKKEQLVGKRVRCEIRGGYRVKECVILSAEGDRRIRRFGME
jgi:hypothetical protein